MTGNNFAVLEIQFNADGSTGLFHWSYGDKDSAEDLYLAKRQAAHQSAVLVHTVMFIDRFGNTIEKKSYTHPQPEPEPEPAPEA